MLDWYGASFLWHAKNSNWKASSWNTFIVCWKTKTFSIVYFGDISITNFVLFYIFELTMKEKRYIVLTTWAWTCGVTLSQVKTSPCLMDLEPRQKGRNYSNDLFSCHQLNNTHHHEWGRGTENFWTCKIHLRSVVNFRAAKQKVWTEKKMILNCHVLCISQVQFWYYEIQIQTYNMFLHHQLLPTTRHLVISDEIVHTQSKKNLMRGEIIGMRELSIIERLILMWPI